MLKALTALVVRRSSQIMLAARQNRRLCAGRMAISPAVQLGARTQYFGDARYICAKASAAEAVQVAPAAAPQPKDGSDTTTPTERRCGLAPLNAAPHHACALHSPPISHHIYFIRQLLVCRSRQLPLCCPQASTPVLPCVLPHAPGSVFCLACSQQGSCIWATTSELSETGSRCRSSTVRCLTQFCPLAPCCRPSACDRVASPAPLTHTLTHIPPAHRFTFALQTHSSAWWTCMPSRCNMTQLSYALLLAAWLPPTWQQGSTRPRHARTHTCTRARSVLAVVFCALALHLHCSYAAAAQRMSCSASLSSADSLQANIFVQSHVSAHAELAWLLECTTPVGWLGRMIQYKASLPWVHVLRDSCDVCLLSVIYF
jgi:tRNA synthetases class I (W and Y)